MDHIVHVQRGKTLQYVLDNGCLSARAKNTYTDLYQGYVQLFYDKTERLVAKQSNILLHLLSVPFGAVGLRICNPYLIYFGKKPVGEIRYKGRCSTMKCDGANYEYRLHSQYISSLTMDGRQIAILQFHYHPHYFYTVSCNEIGEKHLWAVLLLCAYYDARHYANETRFGLSYFPNDPFADRATWKPKDAR